MVPSRLVRTQLCQPFEQFADLANEAGHDVAAGHFLFDAECRDRVIPDDDRHGARGWIDHPDKWRSSHAIVGEFLSE